MSSQQSRKAKPYFELWVPQRTKENESCTKIRTPESQTINEIATLANNNNALAKRTGKSLRALFD